MTSTQRILYYYRRYPRPVLLGSFCVFLSAAIGLLSPTVVRWAIDELRVSFTKETLLRYAAAILVIALLKGLFLYWQRMILIGMSRHIEFDLRNDFYSHLQELPPEFYQRHRVGDLMARATNDLNAVRMLAGPALMYGLNAACTTLLVVPFMLRLNAGLTILALLSFPLVSLATQFFSKRIHDRFESIQEYFSAISARAQENFSGVRVVRAYVQEDHEIDEFDRMNREFVARNLRLIKLTAVFHPLLQSLIALGFVAILWYGGRQVFAGRITIGQYVEFNLYLTILIWPMIALGWIVNLYQRGMASMGRMNAILETAPAIRDGKDILPVEHITGRIEFRDLTFTHAGRETPVLREINLTIEPGQTVAIVGHTGSGKSTLVNLVPRLLDADDGQVLIDGVPIRKIPLQTLRSAMGYVPQETFLFSDTIAKNIAFGAAGAKEEQIREAAAHAGVSGDIEEFPKGYETIVGERGITLSGGQKQRTAIARAIIRQPKILILDDALSSVDTYTEEKILKHLRRLMKQRTSLVVSHRVSTVRDADLIVVLENGEIAERGTHDELIQLGGIYAELNEKQMLEEELAAT